jgi:hypothetical protein
MTKWRTGSVQKLGAELFFIGCGLGTRSEMSDISVMSRAGQEDLAVTVETVDQTFDGVGCVRAHCGKRIEAAQRESSTGKSVWVPLPMRSSAGERDS